MKLREGTPQEAGIRPESVARIKAEAEKWLESGKTPAFVLLAARRGVIFIHESYGHLTPEEGSPDLSKDAIFPIASITKPITATAVMILVEDGLVGLNRPVQEYLPEFNGDGKEHVMVHHLLTHTSGLNDEDMYALVESEGDRIPVIDDRLQPGINKDLYFALKTPLWRPPGEVMNYSVAGYTLLGEILRRVSELPFEKFIEERIFTPLGMKDSYLIVPREMQGRVVRRIEEAQGAFWNTRELMELPAPGYGIYATALDIAKFGQMFLNGGRYGSSRIISAATVAAMTRDQLPGLNAFFDNAEHPHAGWGLGWSIAYPNKGRVYGESLPSQAYYGHGGFGGVEMWIDPLNEIVGVYFSTAVEEDLHGFQIHNADLFMNMVTAGAADDAGTTMRPLSVPDVDRDDFKFGRPPNLGPMKQVRPRATVLARGTAEEAGVDPQRVKKVIELARSWTAAGIHPSLHVIAARHGILFLNETLGHMGPGKDSAPLTSDAIFPLASLTKPITATAIMILVEDGSLGLNRPLQDYLPEFQGQGWDRITVRQLLTHTSGLRDEDHVALAKDRGLTADAKFSDANRAKLYAMPYDAYLELLAELEPAYSPDKKMYYAALNYDLLSEVAARVSGVPFPEFIQEKIFVPLGMKNTYLPVPESYLDRVVRRPESAPAYKMLEALLDSGNPLGGSAIHGTAPDLAIFGQMFLNGGSYGSARILNPASIPAMTRNQIPGIDAYEGTRSLGAAEWGLGWSLQYTKKLLAYAEPLSSVGSFCHGGAGGIFMWVDPAKDLVAVFASAYLQRTDLDRPAAAIDYFINVVLAAVV